ncbi:MAG: CcmD family protein [Ignavibacteriales bacterium]|nr:CcmD family protein [Ignavibacteriales bacterium]
MFEFLNSHQLYIVLGILLLVWVGILWFLFRLDAKVKKLEESVKKGE